MIVAGILLPMQWSLSTQDTAATIALQGNCSVVRSLGAVGDPLPWCSDSPIRFIDRVWTGGVARATDWRFAGANFAKGHSRLDLQFVDGPLTLRDVWTARPGHGPIEHEILIENHSRAAVTVPCQPSLTLAGLDPGGDAQVWWSRRGASNALTEGGVFQSDVQPGLALDLVSNHHVETSPVPWLALQVGRSRGLYVGWEFSSLGRLDANCASPGRLGVSVGLMPDFKTDILPGETLVIPSAFVGCYQGDIDRGGYCLQSFVKSKLRAKVPKSVPDPTLVLGLYLDAGGDKAKEPDVLRCLHFARDLGLETFLCDAMWFPACGDWRWDPGRFPNGPAPIGNAIHRDGMNFGLWCAWTNGGISDDPGALSVRGPYGHPDWFPEDLPSDWKPGPFYGESACMASSGARAWAMAKTQSLVSAGVDYLKTDVHPMINECSRADHRHRYGSDVSYWSTMGVYEVWDALRTKFPGLVLENCSGASHIKDFGVVKRCAYTAVTDTLSNLPDRAGIYDSTFYFPPAALIAYTYENGYNLPGDDPGVYLFRSGMMAGWDLAPTDSKGWSEPQKAAARESIRAYKSWIRPVMQDCAVHHVLPRPDGKRWDGLFYWNQRIGKGVFFVFRPDSEMGSLRVRLAGLNPSKRYLVWSQDGSVPRAAHYGSDLMALGLEVKLPSKYSSDLVYFRQL